MVLLFHMFSISVFFFKMLFICFFFNTGLTVCQDLHVYLNIVNVFSMEIWNKIKLSLLTDLEEFIILIHLSTSSCCFFYKLLIYTLIFCSERSCDLCRACVMFQASPSQNPHHHCQSGIWNC